METTQTREPALPSTYHLELTGDELALLTTALRLLESALGHEEAQELDATQELIERLGALKS